MMHLLLEILVWTALLQMAGALTWLVVMVVKEGWSGRQYRRLTLAQRNALPFRPITLPRAYKGRAR